MAKRIESGYTDPTSDLDDGLKRLGGVALSPGVSCQHIPGHGLVWRFEAEAGASE